MAKKKRARPRHRLLLYARLGQSRRTAPLLTALLGGLLYLLGWLADRAILLGGNQELLLRLWNSRVTLLILIGASLLLYILFVLIARISSVEVRPRALRIRAGLIPIDISYGRIRQIRLVEVSAQYPPRQLKPAAARLLSPFAGKPATAVDLNSWPRQPLRKLWHRFMFNKEGSGLLLIVKDAMLLNQQIDSAIAARQARQSKQSRYQDPIARAAEMAKKS